MRKMTIAKSDIGIKRCLKTDFFTRKSAMFCSKHFNNVHLVKCRM